MVMLDIHHTYDKSMVVRVLAKQITAINLSTISTEVSDDEDC
jgi:hypothetical protein